MEQLKNNLIKSYEWNAKMIRTMLKQPDLNKHEKARIFSDLGQCKMIRSILRTDFEDDKFSLDYPILEQQVETALL